MINWKLESIPINKLKNNPKNPRQITKDQMHHLQRLIEKFGLIDKPIVNLDNVIIGGHQRVRVLKKMKQKTVECMVPDRQLFDEDIDELMIGLNLNQGTFDYDILANEFDAINLLKYGFTEEQLIGKFEAEKEIIEEEEKEKDVKKKECPNCGHEF